MDLMAGELDPLRTRIPLFSPPIEEEEEIEAREDNCMDRLLTPLGAAKDIVLIADAIYENCKRNYKEFRPHPQLWKIIKFMKKISDGKNDPCRNRKKTNNS